MHLTSNLQEHALLLSYLISDGTEVPALWTITLKVVSPVANGSKHLGFSCSVSWLCVSSWWFLVLFAKTPPKCWARQCSRVWESLSCLDTPPQLLPLLQSSYDWNHCDPWSTKERKGPLNRLLIETSIVTAGLGQFPCQPPIGSQIWHRVK